MVPSGSAWFVKKKSAQSASRPCHGHATVFLARRVQRRIARFCGKKIGRKIKRLRLWLCSSRPLLRGSKTTRMHVPSQPLMRSLLSQFQTPTAPRRAVGFFRFGSSPSCPGFLITQPTSDRPRFILGQPFQPSTGVKVNGRLKNVNAAIQCSMWIKRW